MGAPKNRNTIFTPLSYESVFSHLNELERGIELSKPTDSYKRQVPIYVCTIIEQLCRVRKMFAYRDGEPMPKNIRLNMSLLMDMLDWSDNWCTNNTSRHEEVIHRYVKDVAADGSFRIGVDDLHVLIDDACHIRPPLVVESLAASTLNFQGVGAINSLDIADPVLYRHGGIGIEECEALFELRHTNTHTLAGGKFSPRSCVALAKDLFETVLGNGDFLFHRGCALSNAGRHAHAVDCLKHLGGRKDWKYLLHYGRSLAHVGDNIHADYILGRAVASLREHVKSISRLRTNETAWQCMEAARAMCDMADGFRAVEAGHSSPTSEHEAYIREALDICSDLAEAYCLVGSRLSELRLQPDMPLECYKKAYELVENVNTAYWVGIEYFKMEQYKGAEEWLMKARRHDDKDEDVKHALEQVEIRLAAAAGKIQ